MERGSIKSEITFSINKGEDDPSASGVLVEFFLILFMFALRPNYHLNSTQESEAKSFRCGERNISVFSFGKG